MRITDDMENVTLRRAGIQKPTLWMVEWENDNCLFLRKKSVKPMRLIIDKKLMKIIGRDEMIEDVIVEVATEKDSVKYYFKDYADAADFIHTALYAAYNQDPCKVVKFCIYVDNEKP